MKYFERKFAITIGINQYGHGIAPLQTAVQDARVLAATLKSEHDYQVTELLDAAATLGALRELFEKRLPQLVTAQDCLLVYFAGHGIAKQSGKKVVESGDVETEGPVGYLIPQDARPEDEDSFWPMQDMYRALAKLSCRHFLLILDCCFAGVFRWASTRDVLVPEVMYRERFLRFQEKAAWQVLTSASHDQKALDILRDNRGLAHCDGKHSPFAAALLEALTTDKADLISDQVITATELYLYLRDFVEINSEERQTPGLWPLPKHDRGEFFFLAKNFDEEKLEKAPEINADHNPYRGLESYDIQHGNRFFGRDKLVLNLYKNYVLHNSLTVVVGASGTGKSSLVKAGLVPYLSQEDYLTSRPTFKDIGNRASESWTILPMVRPGNDPLSALAKMLFPYTQEKIYPGELAVLDEFQSLLETYRSILPEDFCKLWQILSKRPKRQLMLVLDWVKILENRANQIPVSNCLVYSAKLEALTGLASGYVKMLKETLQADSQLWQSILTQWVESDDDNHLLFVVDQAEELITQSKDEVSRKHFIEYLEMALLAYPKRFRCVLTVRMDFEPLVMQLFSPSWQKGWATEYRMVVPPMTQNDLRQAIEGPANEDVLNFEPPSLVDELINEVVQMPGALPLLSFTLSELYLHCAERWQADDTSRALKQEDYENLGKVSGALRHRANEEFDALDEAGQRTLRNIMLRMVALEGGELARRRVPKTELVYADPAENDRVEEILNRLIEQRLLVSGRSAEGEYVEPAHDVLVRGWEKIAEWLKEEVEVQLEPSIRERLLNAVFLNQARKNGKKSKTIKQLKFDPTLQRQVTEASEQWLSIQGRKDDHDYLWVGDPRLSQLKQIKERQDWLNQKEELFVEKSIQRQSKEARTRIGVILLSFLILGGFTLFTSISLRRATFREQVASAENSLSTVPLNGLIESIKINRDYIDAFEISTLFGLRGLINSSFVKALQTSAETRLLGYESENLNTIAIHSEKHLLVSGDWNGIIQVQDYESQQELSSFSGQTASVLSVDINPEGTLIVSGGKTSGIKLFDLNGNLIEDSFNEINGQVNAVKFINNGTQILSGSGDGTARIWNLNGELVETFFHGQPVYSVAMNSEEGVIFAGGGGDRSGIIKAWELDGKPYCNPFGNHNHFVYSMSMSRGSNGRFLVSAGGDGFIKVWDSECRPIGQPLNAHEGYIYSTAMSADGKLLVSAGQDQEIRVWKWQDPYNGRPPFKLFKTLIGHQDSIHSVAFNSRSQEIFSGGWDGTIRAWTYEGIDIGKPLEQNGFYGKKTEFSADNTVLLTLSGNSDSMFVKWWNTKDGRLFNESIVNNRGRVEDLIYLPLRNMFLILSYTNSAPPLSEGINDSTLSFWNEEGHPIEPPSEYAVYTQDWNFSEYDDRPGSTWHMIDVVVSEDKNFVALLTQKKFPESVINIWDIRQGTISQIAGFGENIAKIQINSEERLIAAIFTDGIDLEHQGKRGVQLYSFAGQRIGAPSYIDENGQNNEILLSPSGKLVAVKEGRFWLLWEIGDDKLKPIFGPNDSITSVAFDAQDSYWMTGELSGIIRLYSTSVKNRSREFQGVHGDKEITALAISPDGSTIISAASNGSLQFWDGDGTPIGYRIQAHTDAISSVSFSADGKKAVSYGGREARLWRSSQEAWIEAGCNRLRTHSVMLEDPELQKACDGFLSN